MPSAGTRRKPVQKAAKLSPRLNGANVAGTGLRVALRVFPCLTRLVGVHLAVLWKRASHPSTMSQINFHELLAASASNVCITLSSLDVFQQAVEHVVNSFMLRRPAAQPSLAAQMGLRMSPGWLSSQALLSMWVISSRGFFTFFGAQTIKVACKRNLKS